MAHKYRAKVRPGGKGNTVEVVLEANSELDALRLAEAQYGKANVIRIFEVV